MKNPIALIKSNPVARKAISEVSKFYLNHESVILTGGTIGFSLATTAVTFKNAKEISEVIEDAKQSLYLCNTKEEKNDVYKLFLRELTPLVMPIIIFQALTIATAIFNKKQYDKKLADAAGALSIAQAAVAQYQAFTKEAEEALGEKKYQKLQEDIYSKKDFDGSRFPGVPATGGPGEVLLIDKYSGKPFWGTFDKCDYAAKELSRMLSNGANDIVTISDWYDNINNPDLIGDGDTGILATKFGYVEGSYGSDDIRARVADTHYIFPNGSRVPAFLVYLYPEPACVDYNCD